MVLQENLQSPTATATLLSQPPTRKPGTAMEVYHIPNVQGFTATNVLTPQECAECVRNAEGAGFVKNDDSGRPLFAGNRSRAQYFDESLAETIFARLSPILGCISPLAHVEEEQEEYRDYDFVDEHVQVPTGVYETVGINPFLRVSKYNAASGDRFDKHTDSAYVRDDQYVGFWTILVYLNDDFEGGETTIYDDEFEKLAYTVKPEVGKVFCFYHYQVHAGLAVQSGTKYIVRSEIMFARHPDQDRVMDEGVE